MECVELQQYIKDEEAKLNHTKTIIVGDLNINPFEDSLICASALHGVMSKQIARQVTRTLKGKKYEYFYNPMWNMFGDILNGPPGTFYYRKANQDTFFWNMFDQVLVRPSLLNRFVDESLRIITGDGDCSYLTKNKTPNVNKYSDHLPILFELNL